MNSFPFSKNIKITDYLKHWFQPIIFTTLILGISSTNGYGAYPKESISITQDWIYNPATAHYYKVLGECTGWHSCENEAITEDAHLVTINDAEEQAWLITTFGGAELFWIGFTDENNEGNWEWISGEPITFTNWAPGEPSNSGNSEHYALMNWVSPGFWNDGDETVPFITKAIIERNRPISNWMFNANTAHYYKVISECSGWHSCEDAALSVDAHLVTINDAEEQTWLVMTFGGAELFWIGFTDENSEGNWQWISAEPITFTNWAPGEPSNSGNSEHYGLMNWVSAGLWNDGAETVPFITKAIIERLKAPSATYLPLIIR